MMDYKKIYGIVPNTQSEDPRTIEYKPRFIEEIERLTIQSNRTTKKKTTWQKKKPKTPVKPIWMRNRKNIILNMIHVVDGIATCTNMETIVQRKTETKNGMYRSLSPVVRGEAQIHEYPEIPAQPEGKQYRLFVPSDALEFISKKPFHPTYDCLIVRQGVTYATDSLIAKIRENKNPLELTTNIPTEALSLVLKYCDLDNLTITIGDTMNMITDEEVRIIYKPNDINPPDIIELRDKMELGSKVKTIMTTEEDIERAKKQGDDYIKIFDGSKAYIRHIEHVMNTTGTHNGGVYITRPEPEQTTFLKTFRIDN